MTALLLAPHNDDETLFASFLCLRYRPHILTLLRSVNQGLQGVTAAEREAETAAASRVLGCSWSQGVQPDDTPDWREVELLLRDFELGKEWKHIFAPWPEPGGHEQHNLIGELAGKLFGDRVTYYTTYTYGGPRTIGTPVPYEPEWILRKLRALACYKSQILNGPRRMWMWGLEEHTRP